MYQSLSRHADVVPLGHPYAPTRLRELLAKIEKCRLQQKGAAGDIERTMSRFRRNVERQLSQERVDLVFAPVASQELSVVEFTQPVVYASDVTCRLLYESYDFGASAERQAEAEDAERMAIQTSTGIIYSSAWAAESAICDYGAAQEKIRVIPYGANFDKVPDSNEIYKKCDRRPWKLVFIGLNWHRKGGDIALQAFEALRRRGVDAELTIIGTEPPERHEGLPVRVFRFLDKRKTRDKRLLNEILLSSHFMLFPTRADCTPIALCEAAAYGIPVVAADVGGISSIVTQNTGRLMPATSTAEEYADAVLDLMRDPPRYQEMVRSSRQRYEDLLNWDKWAESLLAFCEPLI